MAGSRDEPGSWRADCIRQAQRRDNRGDCSLRRGGCDPGRRHRSRPARVHLQRHRVCLYGERRSLVRCELSDTRASSSGEQDLGWSDGCQRRPCLVRSRARCFLTWLGGNEPIQYRERSFQILDSPEFELRLAHRYGSVVLQRHADINRQVQRRDRHGRRSEGVSQGRREDDHLSRPQRPTHSSARNLPLLQQRAAR